MHDEMGREFEDAVPGCLRRHHAGSDLLPGLHAPTATDAPRLRESLAPALVRLAERGILLGTSSWKYPGWCGLVYERERYVFRGEFSDTRFQQRCLEEYAETFPTVGVDATYYAWPTANLVAGLKRQVPAAFRFSFKVTDEILVRRFPPLPRFGGRAGQWNPDFLNADLFARQFLAPLEPLRAQTGVLFLEFSRFRRDDFARGRDFVALLDAFLAALPAGWRYGVEVRNASLLEPEFFAMLRARGAVYVFNAWSGGPPLDAQLERPGAWTAQFGTARLLIRPGYDYETAVQWFQPYDRRLKPYPEGLAAAARMVREAQAAGIGPMFVYLGNKLEGSAPQSVAALAELLEAEG